MNLGLSLFGLLIALSVISSFAVFALHIYGIVLSFKKRWYYGVVALIIPWFAVVIAVAKLLKKDLLP